MGERISFADFKQKARRQLWPTGEAISLVEAHNQFFVEGFIDLCRWVKCLQESHVDVHPACSMYVTCGLSVCDAPFGLIDRVYTIANGDWCSQVGYEQESYTKVNCWSQRLLRGWKAPANAGLPALQQGFRYPDASTDVACGRSRAGIYAIHRKKFWVAPWLQSNESLVIEWDGVKTNWGESDMLDTDYWTPQVLAAVKMFVAWCHQRDYGIYDTSPGEERTSRSDFEAQRAELIYQCEENTKLRRREVCGTCDGSPMPTADQLKAEQVTAPGPMVAAILGDFGIQTQHEADVAAVLKSWNPEFVATTADNWYGSSLNLSDLDLSVGKYYSQFLFPYIGSFGTGAIEQRFFPTFGNHDLDPVGRLDLEKQYFNQPSDYYDFVKGPIHFFMYASGFNNAQIVVEPDGNDVNSKQAAWLQAKLALSTSPFKLVLMHHPPFSSTKSAILVPPLSGDGTISFPALQLPFKAWGADAVIFGHVHNYEVLVGVDGMLYIANGAGGAQGQIANEPAIYFDPPLPISIFRYNDKFGAQRITADCHTLKMEFINTDGIIIDTRIITK